MMRKIFIGFSICIAVNLTIPHCAVLITQAQQETPTYAKWGKLAIKETKSNYPHANIIDYLYVSTEHNAHSTLVKFKLWLRENDKEFGVMIGIEYTNETEQVIKIELKETDR